MSQKPHDISAFVLEPLTFGTNCSKVTGILYLTFPRSSIWDCEIEEGIESVRNRVDSYARGELYLRCDEKNPAEVYETVSVPQEPAGIDMFPNSSICETVVLLSQRKADDYIEIDLDLDEMDITSAETKATYREVQQYVLQTTGLMVSNLNIAQIKDKCGFDKRENYISQEQQTPDSRSVHRKKKKQSWMRSDILE